MSREVTINCPQGIGDIFWIYQKFSPYFDRINFNVCVLAIDQVQTRAKDFLYCFPKVSKVNFIFVDGNYYERLIRNDYSLTKILSDYEIGITTFDYSCNKPLEEGKRIEEIDSELEIEENVKVRCDYAPLAYKNYISLYVSGGTVSIGNNAWDINAWIEFIYLFYKKFNPKLPIILIGASYDLSVMKRLSESLNAMGYQNCYYCDSYAGNVNYILKNSSFHIGYQSGLSILAENYNTHQLMLYLDIIGKMKDSWVKKENIKNKVFNYAFFSEPRENIIKKLNIKISNLNKDHIFLSCGVGDFIAIEGMMTQEEKNRVNTVYWATRAKKSIMSLIPFVFPNTEHHVTLYDNFGEQDTSNFCVESKETLKAWDLIEKNVNFDIIKDMGIKLVSNELFAGKRKFERLSLIDKKLCNIGHFKLPEKYALLHPHSQNARKSFRDIDLEEWSKILLWLERHKITGVIINESSEKAPMSPWLLDLTNQTSLLEAIEITKQASAYIGCSSCFSVVAAKVLPKKMIFIKANQEVKDKWYKIYYAPLAGNDYVYQKLEMN